VPPSSKSSSKPPSGSAANSAAKNPRARSTKRASRSPIAVIDIGSNSGRVVVLDGSSSHGFDVLSDGRASLRLARDIGRTGKLSPAAITRTISALSDFKRLAEGAGASSILAVATSAVREAENQAEFLRQIKKELGLKVRVLSGDEEAEYAFLGAVEGLPIRHGLLFDLGGGSLEVTHFRDRRLKRTWTLPLGALRLTDRFLVTDPPSRGEMRRLREHVRKTFARERIPRLAPDEILVGTGGSTRNLAKVDRRTHPYPISRLHGYLLSGRRLETLGARLASRTRDARAAVPGLNSDRVDSIVGGAICVEAGMAAVGADSLLVSGQGMREGLAFSLTRPRLLSIAEVRAASLEALLTRFASWSAPRAERRADLALRLMKSLDPGVDGEIRAALELAARALDIGRSVDYYNRHRHASMILTAIDLNGYAQREVALAAAVVSLAGDEEGLLETYRPLLRGEDEASVLKASVVLTLADEIEQRVPLGQAASYSCRLGEDAITLRAPSLDAWKPRPLLDRFRRGFGRELRVSRPSGVQKGKRL